MGAENILVVCVGNICRSPMAAALLSRSLQDLAGVAVWSAGLAAPAGSPASAPAVSLMAEQGVDISRHRATQINAQMIRDSSLILVMERSHKRQIGALDPAARGKVFRLCEHTNMDVGDPFGKSENDYRKALTLIDEGVKAWTKKLSANPHE